MYVFNRNICMYIQTTNMIENAKPLQSGAIWCYVNIVLYRNKSREGILANELCTWPNTRTSYLAGINKVSRSRALYPITEDRASCRMDGRGRGCVAS